MNRRNSLKWQIVIGVLFVFLLVQGTFGFITYRNLKLKFEADVRISSESLISFVNQNLDNFIDTPVSLLAQMRTMIPQNRQAENDKILKTYIATIEQVYPVIDHIKIIDQNGNLVMQSTDLEELTTYNYKNESFFINKPKGDEIIWSNLYISAVTNKPTITMSENVGELLLVADINLSQLGTIVHRESFDVLKSISLLDKYGNYMYNDDPLKVEQRQRCKIFDIVKEITQDNTRYITKEDTGNSLIIAENYGFQEDGYLVIELDYDLLVKPLNDFKRNFVVSIIGLFILSLVSISFFMKKIMMDFDHLSAQTRAISNGNYNFSAEPCRYQETQEISMDFLKMREIIESRENKILEINEGLEDTIKERTASLISEIDERKKIETELEMLNADLENRVFDRTVALERSNIILEETNAQLEEEIQEHTNTLIMLREKENDLERALNIAREANMAKTQFLANMSHEIRTPMNGILGMINILIMTSLTEEQSNYLQTIQSSTHTLMSILNDILDFSKIEAGKVSLRHEKFSLLNTLNDLNNLFSSSAVHKGIELNFSVEQSFSDLVYGDEIRLRQILSNLIANAIKFTNDGSINVSCDKIHEENNKIDVRFKITDTGIGISKGEIDHIFDRFVQGSNTEASKTKGTGLGLAISRMLVELMGGKIYLNSQLNIGSEFIVEIPFEVCFDDAQIPLQNRKNLFDGDHLVEGLDILIVEDDLTSAFVMQMMMSKAGAKVDLAENGELAVEKSSQKVYDLILMDVNMPILDGLNATRKIRLSGNLDNKGHPVPIIAITAYANEEDEKRCLSYGVNDYVSKPVDFETLFEKINKLCEMEVSQMEKNKGEYASNASESILEDNTKKKHDLNTVIETLTKESGFDLETTYFVIETYLNQTKEILESIKSLIDSDITPSKFIEIGKLLHKLKGSSGNVRANEVMELAKESELLCNENSMDEMSENVDFINEIVTSYVQDFSQIQRSQ